MFWHRLTNLVRWNASENNDKCRCGKVGVLKRTLSNCSLALNRYTYGQNLVLKVNFNAIKNKIAFINSGEKPLKEPDRDFITFV